MAHLLVVDDDPDSGGSLGEVLTMDGHDVRMAYNGEEGIRRLHERCPDLILLDVEMPVMNGPDMALRVFIGDSGLEKVPIILVSGVADLLSVAREVGTPYFLSKPYRLESLVDMIERALAERTPPNPPYLPERK